MNETNILERYDKYVVESDFEYKGLRCVTIFSMNGWRCGYVGVPKGHKFYGKDYCDIERLLNYGDCHGGLTYSSNQENSEYPVESNLWWFGFDCAHFGDGKDLKLATKLFPKYSEQILQIMAIEWEYPTDEPIRTMEYVIENCKSLANQLV